MIELLYQNGFATIYKIEDWDMLRRQFRIIGSYFSNTQYIPVLPSKLLPEETVLLLKKNFITLVEYDDLHQQPTEKLYADLQAKLIEEQKHLYRIIKAQQMEYLIDKIIQGKRKKGDLRNKEEILEEELARTPDINIHKVIWPILRTSLEAYKGKGKIISLEEFSTKTNETKCAVFTNLWEKGYYVTSGYKFGGDFLIYPGDPLLYHALYIIRCLGTENEIISARELVTFGRLGTSVKKKTVLANIDDKTKNVRYISVSWMEI